LFCERRLFRLLKFANQGNLAGTDGIAAAALDAIRQMMVKSLFQLSGMGVPVELLREKAGRTDLGAGATADAGLRVAS
jgi:hypothetical protein